MEQRVAGALRGYPSTTNQFAIVRDSDVLVELAAEETRSWRLSGEFEAYGAYAVTPCAGRRLPCGFDGRRRRIDRDPLLVARDVERGLVTREWAERLWGVVLTEPGEVPAEPRPGGSNCGRSGAPRRPSRSWAATVPPGHQRMRGCAWRRRSSATLAGIHRSRCRCGRLLGPVAHLCKACEQARFPVQHLGPEVNPKVGGRRFELREFYCRVFHAAGGRDRSARRPPSTTHGCLCELHRRGRQRKPRSATSAIDSDRGIVQAKSPSTPPNFEQGVLAAVAEAAGRLDTTLEDLLGQNRHRCSRDDRRNQHPDHPHRREDRAAPLAATRTRSSSAAPSEVAGLSEGDRPRRRLSKAEPLVPRSSIRESRAGGPHR